MQYIIYILMVVVSATAASFDCSRVQTFIEKTVCTNPEISKADETLASLYVNILNQSSNSSDLIKEQRIWIKERNSCKTDSCILEKYKNRETELNTWLHKEKAKELENCTDRPECWPEGSAMHTGLTYVIYLKKTSIQIKIKFEELIAILSDSPNYNGEKNQDYRIISALTAQQKSWEKYRSDECELIGSITGAGGSWPSTYATICELNLAEARLQNLNIAIQCIQQIPLENRWIEQAECLQKLTPLANKL